MHKDVLRRNNWIPLGIVTVLIAFFFWEIITEQGFLWFDFLLGEYPRRAYLAYRLSLKDIPLWNPFSLGGHPWSAFFFASGSYFYPFNLIYSLFAGGKLPGAYPLEIILLVQLWIAAISTYFLLKNFKLSNLSSLFGSILFTFSYPVVIRMQHTGHFCGIIWLPLIFLLLKKAVDEKNLFFGLLAGLTAGLSIMAAHPQSYLFLILVITGYLIYRVIGEEEKFSTIIISLTVAAVSFLLSAHRLLPELQYAALSERMVRGAKGFIPVKFISNLFIPWLFGKGAHGGDYWGGFQGFWMFVEYAAYIGIIPLVLLIFSGNLFRKRRIRFFWFLLGFSLLFVYGGKNPIHYIFHLFTPGLRFFSRFLPYFALSGAVISAFALDKLSSELPERKDKVKKALISVGALAVIGFIAVLVWKSGLGYRSGREAYRYGVIFQGWVLFLTFMLVSAGILLARKTKFINQDGFKIGAIIILIIDLFVMGMYFNSGRINPDEYYRENNLIRYIKRQSSQEHFRVTSKRFGYLYANSRTLMYRIQSTEGKLANPLRRFDNLKQELRKTDREKYFKLYNVRFELRDTVIRGGRTIYPAEKREYLPRAWIVHRDSTMRDKKAIEYMKSDDFKPNKEVILAESPFNMQGVEDSLTTSSVSIERYSPEEIIIEASTSEKGYLVISEHWYPGWKVEVDGENTEILRANYLFRAVPLDRGSHRVVMKFSSTAFNIGLVLFFFILALSGVSLLLYIRKDSIFNISG